MVKKTSVVDELTRDNFLMMEMLLKKFTYKKGWEFAVNYLASRPTLQIKIECMNSLDGQTHYYSNAFGGYLGDPFYSYLEDDTPKPFYVVHNFPIIPRPMDREAMEHWLLDCVLSVETHEAMEFFKISGKAVFFPDHEPGGNPYKIERKA